MSTTFSKCHFQCLVFSCRKCIVPIVFFRELYMGKFCGYTISISIVFKGLFGKCYNIVHILRNDLFCFLQIFAVCKFRSHHLSDGISYLYFDRLVFFAVAVCQNMKTQNLPGDFRLKWICFRLLHFSVSRQNKNPQQKYCANYFFPVMLSHTNLQICIAYYKTVHI